MKYILTLISLIFINFCCIAQVSVQSANWNDHIDQRSRREIKLLNDQVMACFKSGDSVKLMSIYSDGLKQRAAGKTGAIVDFLQPIITTTNYSLLDEYLCTNSATGGVSSIFKGVSGDNDYKLNYTVFAKETYWSLLLYNYNDIEILVTCGYSKYGNNWKLDNLYAGQYKLKGNTAVGLYRKAEKYFADGDIADAVIMMYLARQLVAPASNIFEYFKLPEMKEFGDKIYKEAGSKLPLEISTISTAPKIVGIEPVVIPEGIFPMINYYTSIPLTDTVKLKAENDSIQKNIGNVLVNINKHNTMVFFRAYNQIPDGKTPMKRYGFVMKISK
ncbi:hypothetical protein [Mucilaginibacter pedocola]|uniref:Uncharacterized protein n=1 Tax=Mucilaginibacter pedocola TaxID=1792845 RepID=A0A1S9PE52_9SPHI|nr:hypothetical protein [Mucilaginibacter pedocola]OOQ58868.1 hypothetical protein BC343_09500 [Mucilaginibacter pedocola]